MSIKTIKRIALILAICLASSLLLPLTALGSSTASDLVLIDPYDYFTSEEKVAIEDNVRKLPETYRYLITPVTQDNYDIKADARKIFANRNFSQDTIFILMYSGARELYITTGDSLRQKKLDDQFFDQELEAYFIPIVVAGGTVAQALIELTNGISRDIPGRIDTGKNEITIPEPPDNNEQTTPGTPGDDGKKFDSWVAVASLVALALIIFLTGIIIYNRKRSNAD
ncbi:MAG: TPM domain-containing protein [Anaerovoracaceae bacterium]